MSLLIDESLCIRCNNCEKACADVHEGTSRLDREAGPTFAQIHVPTSCRHCEHPHCMKDCPPDAITSRAQRRGLHPRHLHRLRQLRAQLPVRRDPDGAARPGRERPGAVAVAALGAGRRAGMETKVYDKSMVKKAVKCDMCKDVTRRRSVVSAPARPAPRCVSPEKFLDYTNAIAP